MFFCVPKVKNQGARKGSENICEEINKITLSVPVNKLLHHFCECAKKNARQ